MSKDSTNLILIPTDFSEVCKNAIEHGIVLAKAMNCFVVILHVVNKDTHKFLDEKKLDEESIHEMMKEDANNYTEKFGVQVDILIKSGKLFDEIKTVNDEIKPKFIILGTHGKVGFQKIAGSYVLKIVTTTKTPTVVVQKKSFSEGYKNIVFPITSSTQDRQKVNWAVTIANAFGARVHLIPKFESEKFHKRRIMNVTKQIKDYLKEYNIDFVDKVSSPEAGNFGKQVIDYAVDNDADLIMTLVDKDKTFSFASWDEQIIFNSSQIPVICINPVDTKKTSWDRGWS
jgi:nucleotide-binding universal stress UspA family protein